MLMLVIFENYKNYKNNIMIFKIIKIISSLIRVLLSSAVAGLIIFIIVKVALKINQIF